MMKLYRFGMSLRSMDMSGGDSVDGPRWTGGYVPTTGDVFVVAPTRALAIAAAEAMFYKHENAKIEETEEFEARVAVVQFNWNYK